MFGSDDITFCIADCAMKDKCYRNPEYIKEPQYPHSYADFSKSCMAYNPKQTEPSNGEEKVMKVLISKGYGAGWSTWNIPEIATDPRVIEAFENGVSEEEMLQLCQKWNLVNEYGDLYMGGYDDLEIVEIPAGTLFSIKEYDGNEYIEKFDESQWIRAT